MQGREAEIQNQGPGTELMQGREAEIQNQGEPSMRTLTV